MAIDDLDEFETMTETMTETSYDKHVAKGKELVKPVTVEDTGERYNMLKWPDMRKSDVSVDYAGDDLITTTASKTALEKENRRLRAELRYVTRGRRKVDSIEYKIDIPRVDIETSALSEKEIINKVKRRLMDRITYNLMLKDYIDERFKLEFSYREEFKHDKDVIECYMICDVV